MIDVSVQNEEKVIKRLKNKVQKVQTVVYKAPSHGSYPLQNRPVIAGAGPAGLFCAYLLAKEGYRPLLIERGAPVEERTEDVRKFWETGVLDPSSNVQFGEGGAGTFSDGKLNTLVKDSRGRGRFVLETFVQFGAPESILYEQKPHIGTDILSEIVSNMRRAIISAGGKVMFHCQAADLQFEPDESEESDKKLRLSAVYTSDGKCIPSQVLILAVGHSARDTFEMLYQKGVQMQPKSFAVGVRIEHPQKLIQTAQYGEEMAGKLPPASYKLTETLENGRGVYTFCMCPGGYVVNASSESGKLAVNGMSYHDRAGENANSAVIVTVTPDDYRSNEAEENPLSGIAFQRHLEENAYALGSGRIPVQRFEDFCNDVETSSFGSVRPQTRGLHTPANVRRIFPEYLAEALEDGIFRMDRKIHGFAMDDALLSGVESRTSSPVRIPRGDTFESNINGLYPCGEGAGYAGGITSAAMDGLKTAEAIIRKYAPIQ